MGRTFGLIMCACYFQQAEDTGHSPEASICVRVLQTGNCTLQDVQHAFVHFPAHLLETKPQQHNHVNKTESIQAAPQAPQAEQRDSFAMLDRWYDILHALNICVIDCYIHAVIPLQKISSCQ